MPIEVRVPQLGESVVDAVVGTWLKHEGDRVEAGETLVELETDKVNVEVTAEESGVLQQILRPEGETVNVGEVIATLEAGAGAATPQPQTAETASAPAAAPVPQAEPEPAPVAAAPAMPAPAPEAEAEAGVRATPGVRRLAAEYGIDLADPATRMHWWTFMAYFDNLTSESETKQALTYRGGNRPRDMSKEQAQHYNPMKRAYALPPKTQTHADAEEALL